MLKIKRVKSGNIHWAKAVAPGGNVTGWTDEESIALTLFDGVIEGRDTMAAVVKHYGNTTNTGVLTFEPGGTPINDAAAVLAEEAARKKAAAESIAAIRDKASRFDAAEQARKVAEEKCKRLESELAELKKPSVVRQVPEAEQPKGPDPKVGVKLTPSDEPHHGKKKA